MYINLISTEGTVIRTFKVFPVQDDKGNNIAFYDKDNVTAYPKGSMSDLGKREFYIEEDVYDKEYWKHVFISILNEHPEAFQIALDHESRKKSKKQKTFVTRKFYDRLTNNFRDVLLYVDTPRNDKEVISIEAAKKLFGEQQVNDLLNQNGYTQN